jgi:hypothetical protein
MSWKWSNTTYYNDEDMQYLLRRVVDSLNGLSPPPKNIGPWKPVRDFSEVLVRYYGGKSLGGNATLAHHGPKAGRLRIGVRRRTQLFGSDLETMAGLAGEDPEIPQPSVRLLALSLVRVLAHQGVRNALRQEYRDRNIHEANTWRWPEKHARVFVDELILPSCKIRIAERAQAGATHERNLQGAEDRVAKLVAHNQWYRDNRIRLQGELEEALAEEERSGVRLASARAKLEALKNKNKES